MPIYIHIHTDMLTPTCIGFISPEYMHLRTHNFT